MTRLATGAQSLSRDMFPHLSGSDPSFNAVALLNEKLLKKNLKPNYDTRSIGGPSQDQLFSCTITIKGLACVGEGTGKTEKQAINQAACDLLFDKLKTSTVDSSVRPGKEEKSAHCNTGAPENVVTREKSPSITSNHGNGDVNSLASACSSDPDDAAPIANGGTSATASPGAASPRDRPFANVLSAVDSVIDKYQRGPSRLSNRSFQSRTATPSGPRQARFRMNGNNWNRFPENQGPRNAPAYIPRGAFLDKSNAPSVTQPANLHLVAVDEAYTRIHKLANKLNLMKFRPTKLSELESLLAKEQLVLKSEKSLLAGYHRVILKLEFRSQHISFFIGKSDENDATAEQKAVHHAILSLLGPILMKVGNCSAPTR